MISILFKEQVTCLSLKRSSFILQTLSCLNEVLDWSTFLQWISPIIILSLECLPMKKVMIFWQSFKSLVTLIFKCQSNFALLVNQKFVDNLVCLVQQQLFEALGRLSFKHLKMKTYHIRYLFLCRDLCFLELNKVIFT